MALRVLLTVIFLLSPAATTTATSHARLGEEIPIFPLADPAILQALGTSHNTIRFARFARQYDKIYDSEHEIQRRFEIFNQNMEQIEASNQKGLSYSLAANKFADLTWEEFRARWLGAPQNCSAAHGNHIMTDKKLPKKRDWRKEGIVSHVKDQGHCGSCWSFSATGALEAAYTQLTGKPVSLSEQQLIDCSTEYNNFGCLGGFPSQAFQYIKDNGGIEAEESYPYNASNGACKFNKTKVAAKLIDSINITMGSEDELKHAVGIVRPVSVGFEVVESFRFYEKGVYKSKKCGSSPEDLNHAVLVVGYGEEDGVSYWIIKNSWGKEWGDKGYVKLELGKNMCGVATCACYPIAAA
ncbi:cysteine proteinase 2-like [Phalaenopsis equestris]|uniref:cysteine proteinase 2-like n=1 Tax=Phalaenopsis equestris TaxID=78828 RepID=UPI0009E3DAF9|nr:cysteine proteinase 2-like [Phalaenopsis equestris]